MKHLLPNFLRQLPPDLRALIIIELAIAIAAVVWVLMRIYTD